MTPDPFYSSLLFVFCLDSFAGRDTKNAEKGAKSTRSHALRGNPGAPGLCVIRRLSASRCVTGEDEVAIFGLLVAGKAGFEQRRVARFVAVALVEMTEPPAARGGVFL